MPPEVSPLRRLVRAALASATQLRLELKILTGGRTFVLLIVVGSWFGLFAFWAHARANPWDPAGHYNRMLVVPATLLAIALSMGSVIGDRDSRQLETIFVSPSGRHSAWVHRFTAIFVACWGAAGLLSLLTGLFVEPAHAILPASLHSAVPILFAISLTVLLSIAFRGAAVAALVASLGIGLSLMFADPLGRLGYWFNPLAAPSGPAESEELFRAIVFNRSLYLSLSALCFWISLAWLQRRERLL